MLKTQKEVNMDFVSCTHVNHREAIVGLWKDAFAQYGCEKRSAAKVFDALPVTIKEQATDIYNEVTFQRRRYGRADFYCWPIHSIFEKDLIDPWPASRYPKAVLLVEIAKRLTL